MKRYIGVIIRMLLIFIVASSILIGSTVIMSALYTRAGLDLALGQINNEATIIDSYAFQQLQLIVGAINIVVVIVAIILITNQVSKFYNLNKNKNKKEEKENEKDC